MKTIFLCILLAACARLGTLPPDAEVANKLRQDTLNRPLNLSEVWFNLFTEGKKARASQDFKLACEKFGRLISYEEFPLFSLAQLYQLETCARTGNAFPLQELNELEKGFPTGLKSEFYEVAYALAKDFGNPSARAQSALHLAGARSIRNEKEKLLQEAWELAPAGEIKTIAQEKLFQYAPRFNPNPTKEDLPNVARDFERAREFDKAKQLYQQILREDPTRDFQRWLSAANRYRLIFKNERDKEGHIRETNLLKRKLEQMLHKKADSAVIDALAEMMVQEARALWTENHRTQGDLILKRALELLPTMSVNSKSLILWIRGMMALEAKNHNDAKALFRQALELEPSDKKVLQDIIWNLAWTYYLDQENDAFLSLASETQEKLGEDMYERLEFWKGKALYRAGRLDQALETWRELYKKSPFNYYGLMAHVSVGGEFKSITASTDDSVQSLEVEWLASLQEWDLCRQFLDDWRSSTRLDSSKEKWLPSFIRCRHAAGAIRLYYSHSDAGDIEFMEKHLASLYPLSFKDEVFNAAKKFSVDPYLMQSIIRQESAFNPEARSPADAFGLMQLIPELAKRLGQKHRIPYKEYSDLYTPVTNVTLGAAYIRELMGRMNQRMVGVIGAYNAGTGPIFNWYKTRPRKDVFEFIEEIAYEETRNYIKLVLRNWIIYQQIERYSSFSLPLKQLH